MSSRLHNDSMFQRKKEKGKKEGREGAREGMEDREEAERERGWEEREEETGQEDRFFMPKLYWETKGRSCTCRCLCEDENESYISIFRVPRTPSSSGPPTGMHSPL